MMTSSPDPTVEWSHGVVVVALLTVVEASGCSCEATRAPEAASPRTVPQLESARLAPPRVPPEPEASSAPPIEAGPPTVGTRPPSTEPERIANMIGPITEALRAEGASASGVTACRWVPWGNEQEASLVRPSECHVRRYRTPAPGEYERTFIEPAAVDQSPVVIELMTNDEGAIGTISVSRRRWGVVDALAIRGGSVQRSYGPESPYPPPVSSLPLYAFNATGRNLPLRPLRGRLVTRSGLSQPLKGLAVTPPVVPKGGALALEVQFVPIGPPLRESSAVEITFETPLGPVTPSCQINTVERFRMNR